MELLIDGESGQELDRELPFRGEEIVDIRCSHDEEGRSLVLGRLDSIDDVPSQFLSGGSPFVCRRRRALMLPRSEPLIDSRRSGIVLGASGASLIVW